MSPGTAHADDVPPAEPPAPAPVSEETVVEGLMLLCFAAGFITVQSVPRVLS